MNQETAAPITARERIAGQSRFPLHKVNLASAIPAPPRCSLLAMVVAAVFSRTKGAHAWLMLSLGWATCAAPAATLPAFDFRVPNASSTWRALHDVSRLEPTSAGLTAHISGDDPYFTGPARSYPEGVLLWLNLRLRSEAGGTAQVFYFREGTAPTEPDSVRFAVRAGVWETVRVPLPPLGTPSRLRIDPPGQSGVCVLERLWFEERTQFAAPQWPRPMVPTPGKDAIEVTSGTVRLTHGRSEWGGFVVQVDGRPMAVGLTRPLMGYVVEGQPRWWRFSEGIRAEVSNEAEGVGISLAATDPDGGRWTWRQVFQPGSRPGTITASTTVEVDRDREVLHLAPLTLFAGLGTFGTNKQQALLAGVEYLENEPSSSQADLEGPQARRQVADTAKLTFPLAAVMAEDRYVGLIWERQPSVSVVFDSPDRMFQSGGHLLGLVVPGSDGLNRDEGSLVPYDTLRMEAGVPRTFRAELIGGRDGTAVAAVRHYVGLRGLPPLPDTGHDLGSFARLMARGWLDSEIRDGDQYKHAVVGPFTAAPAADAAWSMDWLAERVGDVTLAERLRHRSTLALAQVPVDARWASGVGHIRYPVAPLVYGAVEGNARSALSHGQNQQRRFDEDGTLRYRPRPGAIDYGRTHWTNEANGLTAQAVSSVLETGAFSGDRSLMEAGVRLLRALSKFRNGVPRGAQTWEIALHTPDVLGAAHLVRAYTLGYELTGEPEFLAEARYWAWTGVPFVYLESPTPGPVGLYATTPVLGATQWVAPNWIGLPVQWCGLVYADALYRLARHDPESPWQHLANGITASGLQQTYPGTDPRFRGLLPDSFSLRPQQRNPANINPATLFACGSRWIGGQPVYDMVSFRSHRWLAHAAGEIEVLREARDGVAFRVKSWPTGVHRVLVNGVHAAPNVRLDGREIPLEPPHTHRPLEGRLILEVTGSPRIELFVRP